MKRNVILMLVLFIFCTPFVEAQVSLDTIFIKSKKKVPATIMPARYYYYPNLEAYYDATEKIYYYHNNRTWIASETLPNFNRGYSFRNGLYVMINDYFGEEPYSQINLHKKKFPPDYSTKRKPKNPNIPN